MEGWRYAVTVHGSGARGTLVYRPDTLRAVLTDATGAEVDAGEGIGAWQLMPGSRVALARGAVTLLKEPSDRSSSAPPPANVHARGPAAGEPSVFALMYTAEKHKKRPTWHDGSVRVQAASSGPEAVFADDAGRVLHRRAVKDARGLYEGLELESARHKFEVGARLSGAASAPATPEDSPAGADDGTGACAEECAEGPVRACAAPVVAECQFTADRTQRIKRWREGTVRWDARGVAVFCDEDGRPFHRRPCRAGLSEIVADLTFTTARYIVTVVSTRVDVSTSAGEAVCVTARSAQPEPPQKGAGVSMAHKTGAISRPSLRAAKMARLSAQAPCPLGSPPLRRDTHAVHATDHEAVHAEALRTAKRPLPNDQSLDTPDTLLDLCTHETPSINAQNIDSQSIKQQSMDAQTVKSIPMPHTDEQGAPARNTTASILNRLRKA